MFTFWSLELLHGPLGPIPLQPLSAHLGGDQLERVGVAGRGGGARPPRALDRGEQAWGQVAGQVGGTDGSSEHV